MKTKIGKYGLALLALVLITGLLEGCATKSKVAFTATATLEATADHAMIGWRDYVAWYRYQPSPNIPKLEAQRAQVAKSYGAFRSAMNTVYDFQKVFYENKAAAGDYKPLIDAASAASSNLVNIINIFTSAKPATQ